MIQVALASGFGSVRRFNEIFHQLYEKSWRRGNSALVLFEPALLPALLYA
jgi:transcriptional regulator GlxA family with amidase domain